MRTKGYAALLVILSCLVVGCETPYGQKLDDLSQQRQAGKISEAEYQAELKQLHEEQPWGTVPQAYDGPRARGTVSFP